LFIIDPYILIWSSWGGVYFTYDKIIGGSCFIFGVLGMWLFHYLNRELELLGDNSFEINVGIFVVSWFIINFMGYLIFEKRMPSLMRNLVFIFWSPFLIMTNLLYEIASYR